MELLFFSWFFLGEGGEYGTDFVLHFQTTGIGRIGRIHYRQHLLKHLCPAVCTGFFAMSKTANCLIGHALFTSGGLDFLYELPPLFFMPLHVIVMPGEGHASKVEGIEGFFKFSFVVLLLFVVTVDALYPVV